MTRMLYNTHSTFQSDFGFVFLLFSLFLGCPFLLLLSPGCGGQHSHRALMQFTTASDSRLVNHENYYAAGRYLSRTENAKKQKMKTKNNPTTKKQKIPKKSNV